MKTLSIIIRYAILIGIFLLVAQLTDAQLTIKGKIYSDGPVKASLTHQSDGNTYTCYITKQKTVTRDSSEVLRAKYFLPWKLEPNYNHAINFTDGTVDKMIYIHGAVPEGIYPKQTYIIDIDLTDSKAGETLVVFWSELQSSYLALPLSQIDEINRLAYEPITLPQASKF